MSRYPQHDDRCESGGEDAPEGLPCSCGLTRLYVQRARLRDALAEVLPWAEAWRKLGEARFGPMGDMAARIETARALLNEVTP